MSTHVPISRVWRDLSGPPIRNGRSKAFWRNGDDDNIDLDDAKNVWFDHVVKNGGGVVDLVRVARGCGRKAAAQWLRDKYGPSANGKPPQQGYTYRDERGVPLFQVVRYYENGKKRFAAKPLATDGQPLKGPNGEPIKTIKGVRRVIYRLDKIAKADPATKVFVVEGEKDVETLESIGLLATCNPFGAKKWESEYSKSLTGRYAVIVPDNDKDGKEHALQVARSMLKVAASVRIVELPGVGDKEDVSDWLAGGHTKAELENLTKGAEALDGNKLAEIEQRWGLFALKALTAQPQAQNSEGDIALMALLAQWPSPLAREAYYGLVGDIVQAIEPHTEADPVALLLQLLTGFGNLVGRSPYFQVEATKHRTNLFPVLVGETSKARKGTSWAHIKNLLASIDAEWASDRIQSGLASGEGLIWAVRDPIKKSSPIKERGKGRITEYQTVIEDQGIEDKRLLVIEEEFARVLQVANRDTNTLSATMRQAWDTGDLRTLAKNAPAKATGAHISTINHITIDELRRRLNSTEAANGFANRHLFTCVRRSKVLPEGGKIQEVNFAPLLRRLQEAAEYAKNAGQIRRDDTAREIWNTVYEQLSTGRSGLAGSVTSRAEAQVVRLSIIYALLDSSDIVRAEHLQAALAVWTYCEQSALFIFGDSLGDKIADEILKALRCSPIGMTRTDIREHFHRHKSSQEIDQALLTLVKDGLATSKSEETGGRSAERWFACSPTCAKSAISAVSPKNDLV